MAKASDYPDLEEEYTATLTGEGQMELEEDVDIEVREEEPPFLAGQTKLSLELSPIRVVKAPDGSMNRAAMAGATLAKERKEIRQQEARGEGRREQGRSLVSVAGPHGQPSRPEIRKRLQEGSARPRNEEMPEWKRIIQDKGQSFGSGPR